MFPHWNPKRTQDIAKDIGYFPQTYGKFLLLRTMLTYNIEHREVMLVFN